jgi:2'-hydroxyisoflavone reductase
VWADDAFLVERGVGQWMELPLWLAGDDTVGMHQVDVSRAVAAGLRFRPLDATVADTAEWDAQRSDRDDRTVTGADRAGMAPERERELLAELGRR